MAKAQVAGRTETGRVRQANEDAFRIYHDSKDLPTQSRGSIFVVADGMGSYRGAAMAASIAVDQVANYYQVPRIEFQANRTLEQFLFRANEVVADMRKSQKDYYGMGTTVCAVLTDPSFRQAFVYYAGDSPVYLFRQGKLLEATHAQVDESGALTNHVGLGKGFSLEKVKVVIQPGDQFLLCSDGLSGALEQEFIKETLESCQDASACLDVLVDKALETSRDNITAILLSIEDSP